MRLVPDNNIYSSFPRLHGKFNIPSTPITNPLSWFPFFLYILQVFTITSLQNIFSYSCFILSISSSFFISFAFPLWQRTHPILKCGSLFSRSLSTTYPLYISSGRTGGGAPAHPSPVLGGKEGGLCIDFIRESLVWHITQLFVTAAKLTRLKSRKTRRIKKGMNFRWLLTKPPKVEFKVN